MGKKICIFIGGMVVGSILTILILMAMGMHEQTNKSWAGRDGLVLFEEDGDEIPSKQLKVFQTLDSNCGLAYVADKTYGFSYMEDEYNYLDSLLVLLISDVAIYDDMIIDFDNDKHLIQVGTFNYKTVNKEYDLWKTVPAVMVK